MTSTEVGRPTEAPPDPVAEALCALVGQAERLSILTAEYQSVAQIAALRGTEPPASVYDQTLDAANAYIGALIGFQKAARAEEAPLWEWARLCDLRPGDRIQAGALSPEGDPWVTVTDAWRQTDGHPTWYVRVAEMVAAYAVGRAGDNVRRQTVAVTPPRATPPTDAELLAAERDARYEVAQELLAQDGAA